MTEQICQAALQAGHDCQITISIGGSQMGGWQAVLAFGIFGVIVAIVAAAITYLTLKGK